jgi:cyclomaltodextrinase
MPSWIQDALIYHIFPLGALGAPSDNDFHARPISRLNALSDWFEPMTLIGANAVLLGPVFESGTHGYDTVDYFQIDRRLGTNEDFLQWCSEAHQRGFHIILDGVFHHVGRDFFAFQDVIAYKQSSPFCSWFFLDFERAGAYDTPFWYEGWQGHYDLVKLNVHNPEVKAHLFHAVQMWMDMFAIDGLRLDAADVLDLAFQQELAAFCRDIRPDFWLMGEVIHGNYRRWVNSQTLSSVTNYEVYKGLYSSHNDRNYFEITYSLNRQFGPTGIYRDLQLYNFVDNHDVDRVASKLNDPAHLFPLYGLLFTIPGITSIYYGSEWGLQGQKAKSTDAPLRPAITPSFLAGQSPYPELINAIRRFSQIRQSHVALRLGDYQNLYINHEQMAFLRSTSEEEIIVMVNAAHHSISIQLPQLNIRGKHLIDILNTGNYFDIGEYETTITLDPCWIRIYLVQ